MIPPVVLIRYIVPLLLAVGAMSWAHHKGAQSVQKKWDADRQAIETANARDALRRAEANLGVSDAYIAKEKQARAAIAAANHAANGLRNELDAIRNDAANADTQLNAKRVGVLAELLAQSAGLVEESVERVTVLETKLTSLQQYVRDVCLTAP